MSVAAAVRSIGLRRIAGAGNSSVSSSSHNMNAPKPLSPENNIISVSVSNHAHDGGSDDRDDRRQRAPAAALLSYLSISSSSSRPSIIDRRTDR